MGTFSFCLWLLLLLLLIGIALLVMSRLLSMSTTTRVIKIELSLHESVDHIVISDIAVDKVLTLQLYNV